MLLIYLNEIQYNCKKPPKNQITLITVITGNRIVFNKQSTDDDSPVEIFTKWEIDRWPRPQYMTYCTRKKSIKLMFCDITQGF